MYIHERDNWTDFRWNDQEVALLLDEVTREQGKLYGRLGGLGFESQLQATAENLTRYVVYSSEIEGVRLKDISVRDEAALASQLTDEIKALVPGEDVTILIDHNYSE